jgi:hypothetical protein
MKLPIKAEITNKGDIVTVWLTFPDFSVKNLLKWILFKEVVFDQLVEFKYRLKKDATFK